MTDTCQVISSMRLLAAIGP